MTLLISEYGTHSQIFVSGGGEGRFILLDPADYSGGNWVASDGAIWTKIGAPTKSADRFGAGLDAVHSVAGGFVGDSIARAYTNGASTFAAIVVCEIVSADPGGFSVM